ncbi:MAG: hypothetical protein H0V44_14480 [Planctomycetes bacterium]|nr:hypothetical protein [Planctomycetota bacterium]
MGLFVLAIIFALVGAVLLGVPGLHRNPHLVRAGGFIALVIAIGLVALSTAIFVDDDKGGIVVRKFGPNLPPNRVVASHGEKGPQAEVLGPGWHFGYWPWLYDLNLVDTLTVDQGHVGVVSALDGKPMPPGEIFAPRWESSEDMLDGRKFLAEGLGYRGPQLTVLTPGRYRFNPRLFSVVSKPALMVDVGEVAVIKSNTGLDYQPAEGATVELVNGTPLVPDGYRGIWRTPRTPGAYYMHPDAFTIIKVKTTNRTYTYQDKHWAIRVRSKDGFTFPVDVRMSVSISASEAAHLVALLGNPDQIIKDDQEDEIITVLEARVILPLIRTIFRNTAETMNALQFVNSRSKVESEASNAMRTELGRYRIASEGVFIGNIELDETDAGKQLLATMTEREVALNQQGTFKEKQNAEEARARFILAQEEAEQQRKLAQAKYQVLVREQEAKAREVEATGEARYISITAEAKQQAYTSMARAIGAQGVTMLELLKVVADGKVQITPQVMVGGGGAGVIEALAGTMLGRAITPVPDQATGAASATSPGANSPQNRR